MPSHPIDFQIQSHVYSSPDLLAIFDEKKRFQRWLDYEAALAHVQGELGIIPKAAASEINSRAKLDLLDLSQLQAEYDTNRNSLIPIIKGLRQACSEKHGEYVHYGATTQDVLDTSEILEIKDTLSIIFSNLLGIESTLLDISRRHRTTPIIGRTHGQQALPITFGLKSAIWLSELRRHLERIKNLAPRLLVGQLSGAVGSMAALGPQAQEVAIQTLARLSLCAPEISWHTARDNIAEMAGLFAMLSSTMEKIASEILQLSKTEIAELAETSPKKAMSSSTMPHKRNPVLCQRIAVLARHVRSLSGIALESMVHEHERDARALWSEWLAIPQISIYTGTAVKYLSSVLSNLDIYPEKMMENLNLHKSSVISEWLLFRLSSDMGKMSAQRKLHEIYSNTSSPNHNLVKTLQADPEVSKLLKPADYTFLDHPEQYCGQAAKLVDTVMDDIDNKRKTDDSFFDQWLSS